MADDLHILNAQFLDRGWIVTELPDPQVVMDVRHGLEAKLRTLVRNDAATLETYHLHASDETHDELQWALSQYFWEHRMSRKIFDAHIDFFTKFISLDLHIQKTPYLRIARPGKPLDNIGYHRDTDYGASPYELSCHVPLTNVDRESCLRVLDGSHLIPKDGLPRVTGHVGDVARHSAKHKMGFVYLAQRLPSEFGDKMTRVPLRVGQMLMISLSLAHGQEVNRGTQTRVSFDARLVNSLAPINWQRSVTDQYYEPFTESAVHCQAELYLSRTAAAQGA